MFVYLRSLNNHLVARSCNKENIFDFYVNDTHLGKNLDILKHNLSQQVNNALHMIGGR